MRVLVAGATGVIGRPLVRQLLDAGHDVSAITRSEAKARELRDGGIEAHVADALDRDAVVRACEAARPEVVVHQLTALSRDLDRRRTREGLQATSRLRTEATPHLVEGARRAGARKVVAQSISFVTAPKGPPVHDEDAPLAGEEAGSFVHAVRAVAALERSVLGAPGVEGLVLRYGFFYGPGTSYAEDGATVAEVRRRRLPVVGRGRGISSFLHVDDAVRATVLGLDRGTGVLNVCDDDPAPMREWVPRLAAVTGAGRPLRVPAWVARLAAGSHAVHFGERLRGNSNARAKAALGWAPARPSWRQGFEEELGRGG